MIELPVKIKLTGQQEVQAGLNNLTSSWNLQAKAIQGMVEALGATAVFAGALSFLKAAHQAAQESRTSMTLLTAQLGFYSSALNDQAEALSKTLFIQKNEILAADQRLLLYTREETSIKKLIPGIIDLAKVKGVDLATAANAVGLSLKRADESAAGHTITIRGLGVAFKATGTEAGNVVALEDALKKAVGGSAQAVADSLDGWSKLGFWTKRITEDFGKIIFGLSKAEQATIDYNTAMDLAAKGGTQSHWTDQYGMMHDAFIKATKKELEDARKLIDIYDTKVRIDKKKAADSAASQHAADMIEENEKLQKEIDKSTLEGKKKLLLEEKEEEIKKGADAVLVNKLYGIKIGEIDKEIATKKEEDIRKTVKAEEKAYAEMKTAQEEDAKAAYENQQKAKEKNIELARKAIKEEYQIDLASAKQKTVKSEREIAIVQAKYKKEIALAKLSGGSITEIEAEEAQEVADIKRKQVEDRDRALGDTIKNLQALASKHKEWAIAYKTSAIGQAMVDTYKSAESVYAGFATIPIIGPELGVAAAALAVAAGLSNVQQIAAQKMAYGGVVTGGVPGQDSVPAMLMPGEVVYNPAHPNPALESIITNTDNSNTSSHNYHISMPITIHGNPTNTTVAQIGEVTEKALVRALKRAQNMGKISGLTVRA